MYSELKADRVIETIKTLERRIVERFPNSGLSKVGLELQRQAEAVEATVAKLCKPVMPLRIGSIIGSIGVAGTTLWIALTAMQTRLKLNSVNDLLQTTEAAVNVIILLSMAIFFLYSLENRVKQKITLKMLHRLRSIVHIIDMHQLTKDPEFAVMPGKTTSSSPKRISNRFLLVRYLDYCSELLSLTSKVAALHLQYLHDPVVLNAVNDIESLASSLSNKIWQKIMILDATIPNEAAITNHN